MIANTPSHNGLPYDPDQAPVQKREVRRKYRGLTKGIEELKVNPNDISAEQLESDLHRADELFDQVKGPQEATLDSRWLLIATNINAQKARAMKSGSGGFDIDDFITKLVGFMGGRRPESQIHPDSDDECQADDIETPLVWDRIGLKALEKSRRVPALSFMLGPLSVEQKKRGPIKRARLEKNQEDERRPQEIKEEDISRSLNETTKNVAVVERVLEEHGEPINIFRLIINPNDFAQSVENLFHLSFLIRDGKVALETNQQGEPEVYFCEQPSPEDYEGGLQKRQIVMEFDMSVWKRAIGVFNITDSKIPQRPKAMARLGDKWYG